MKTDLLPSYKCSEAQDKSSQQQPGVSQALSGSADGALLPQCQTRQLHTQLPSTFKDAALQVLTTTL